MWDVLCKVVVGFIGFVFGVIFCAMRFGGFAFGAARDGSLSRFGVCHAVEDFARIHLSSEMQGGPIFFMKR